jgi:hypothetical protein
VEARLKLTPHYLETFTGARPREEDLASLRAYAMVHAAAEDFSFVSAGR